MDLLEEIEDITPEIIMGSCKSKPIVTENTMESKQSKPIITENSITFSVADKKLEKINEDCYRTIGNILSVTEKNITYSQKKTIRSLIQSSFKQDEKVISYYKNGLVGTVFRAYCDHHDIELRPDDFWTAIISQFASYVNANAELLRKTFVSHEDKIDLVVYGGGNRFTVDYSEMTQEIINLMKPHLNTDVESWFIPDYSTTTLNDKTVAYMMMMGTLKNYFSYGFCLSCGIPNVTLLGTVEDYLKLRAQIDNLLQYDLNGNIKIWHGYLTSVCDQLIETRKGNIDPNFWNTICSHLGGGSGPRYISGWIASFAAFDVDGKWQGDSYKGWPKIDTNDIPPCYTSCPVKINDNGDEIETTIYAGSWCAEVLNDGTKLRPRSDWGIYQHLVSQAEIDEKMKSPY